MFRSVRPILIVLAAALLLAAPARSRADESMDSAVSATRTLLNQAHDALSNGKDVAALRQAIEHAFAFDVWERYLIEDRADRFTPEQRAEFRSLLPGYMAKLYAQQFDRGLSDPPAVGEARKVRRDYLVSSAFKRRNAADLPVEWRLRDFPGPGPQVIDMMVAGTSFLLLRREEFHAIIDKSGADGLLSYMRENSL